MSSTSEPSFQKILTGRHAIHDFDPTVKIDRQELTQMITEATLAPSALNVQPWRIVVIDSPAMKLRSSPSCQTMCTKTRLPRTNCLLR